MSSSDNLWPDPGPIVSWEVWNEDTFDREARPMRDRSGTGLASGLKALWVRFLLETVRPDGAKGFTRFYMTRRAGDSIRIQGPWEGAIRLRKWIFGDRMMTSRRRLEAVNRQLFEAIIHTHAQMVLLGGTSEPILAAAAFASDRSEFGDRLERLAEPWDVRLNYSSLGKAPFLDPLPELKPKQYRLEESQKDANEETRRRPAPTSTSWIKEVPKTDYRLVGVLAFLLVGLFLLVMFGRQASLICTRIEPQEIDCVHQASWFNLIMLDEQPLDGVWRARVQQVCDVNGCAAFLELDTEHGPVRLGDVASSGSSPVIPTVDEINLFLNDEQTNELTLKFKYGMVKLIIPILSFLLGTLFIIGWLVQSRKIRK